MSNTNSFQIKRVYMADPDGHILAFIEENK